MNSNDTKSMFQSKGVLGAAVAVLAGIMGIFGYAITPEDQEATVELAALLIASVGGAVALWGRITAKKCIKGV